MASEIAPLGGVRLAGEEIAEEDAVAGEEHAGGGLHGGVVEVGPGDARLRSGVLASRARRAASAQRSDQRPAVVRAAARRRVEVGRLGGGGLAAGIHQGAELVEAVGGGEAGGGELPEGVLGLLSGEGEVALEVGGEAGAALVEEGADAEGFGAEGVGEVVLFDALLGEGVGEPVGGLAEVEGDGGGVGGDDAARCAALACGPGGVRGDAAPADGAGEAEVVEPAGDVVGDAGGEEGALPLDGGGFEAFELREGVRGRLLRR